MKPSEGPTAEARGARELGESNRPAGQERDRGRQAKRPRPTTAMVESTQWKYGFMECAMEKECLEKSPLIARQDLKKVYRLYR